MAVLINGLTERYSGSTVVDGVDLDARDGRVTGFLDRNGASESTTLPRDTGDRDGRGRRPPS